MRAVSWWHLLVAVYLFLFVATTIFPYFPDSRFKWFIMFNFTLSAEMNLAVWVSGISLLAMALLAYELFSRKSVASRYAWLVLAIVFLGLSLDEIGSLHERIIDEWRTMIPYLAVGAVLLAFSLGQLFYRKETRKTAVLILVGFGLFGTVALQEIVEHAVDWPDWAMGLRVGIEEGTELLGMSLIFMGIVHQRQRYLSSNSFEILIANPRHLTYLSYILGGGLLLHFLALTSLTTLTDLGLRGVPAALYPVLLYAIMAAAAFWQYKTDRNPTWQALSAYLITSSAGILYLSHLLLDTVVWFPGACFLALPTLFLWRYWIPQKERRNYLVFVLVWFLLFGTTIVIHSRLQFDRAEIFGLLANFYFLSQFILLTAFTVHVNQDLPKRSIFVLSVVALLSQIGVITGTAVLQFLAVGLLTYVIAYLFLYRDRSWLLKHEAR